MKEKPIGTLHGLAMADALDVVGGRCTKLTRPSVVGSEPIVRYPDQPASSPWRCDPVPNEQPLGCSVEDQPPTGKLFEQERSRHAPSSEAGDAGAPPSSQPPSSGGGAFKRRI
jgi:hypothetical protein